MICTILTLKIFQNIYNISFRNTTTKLLPFYQEHYEDFKEGIWFFLEGHKDNFSLNHLKRKVPCWKAKIEDDAIVYEPNWEKIITLDDPLVKSGGCYLPKREMYKIHNVQKIHR